MCACPSSRPPVRAAAGFRFILSGFRPFLAGWTLLGIAFLAGHPSALRADIQQPNKATAPGERKLQRRAAVPPSAVSAQVEVHQGERIEILLEAHGDPGKTLNFLLRTVPGHGTLEGPPRQVTRNTALVTYLHRAEDGPGRDTFTFAVQARSGVVSAPETVDIDVLDNAPSVAALPAELDFGAVKAGESTRAEVTLENQGGGVAAGRLEPPSPWIVEGRAEYRLAHGARQTFQIVFQPQEGRAFAETLHLGFGDGHGVRLVGTGLGGPAPMESDRPKTVVSNNRFVGGPDNGQPSVGIDNGSAAPAGTRPARLLPATTAVASPVPATGSGRTTVAGATPAASLDNASADDTAGGASSPVSADGGYVSVNQARVMQVEVGSVGTNTVELSWKPPVPLPRSYRVELRYLTYDESALNNLRIDWRPYAQVEIRPRVEQVTATLRGLPVDQRQTLRVVAVNEAGQLAPPSPTQTVTTRAPSTWWNVTPLKVLFGMLALCLAAVIHKRWDDHQILRELDERRAKADDGLIFHR